MEGGSVAPLTAYCRGVLYLYLWVPVALSPHSPLSPVCCELCACQLSVSLSRYMRVDVRLYASERECGVVFRLSKTE